MNNTKRWKRLVAAGFLGIAAASPLRAQDAASADGGGGAQPPNLVQLDYENGRMLQPYLPYSRPFVITGSPVTSRGRADVVWGRISEARDTARAVTTSCWVRPAGAPAETKFRTVFDRLVLGREYRVRLTFATAVDTAITAPGVRAGLRAAAEAAEASKRAPNTDDVSQRVTDAVRTQVANQLGGDTRFVQITTEGQCADTGEIQVRITDADARRLLRAVAAKRDLDSARAREGRAFDALQQINGVALTNLAAALRTARNNPAYKNLPYTLADVSALQTAVSSLTLLDQAAWDRLNGIFRVAAPAPPVLRPYQLFLEQTLATLRQVRSAQQAVVTKTADEAREAEAVNAIVSRVLTQFVPISEASKVETSWGAEAEVRKLQIGTAVSGASVFFGPNGGDRDGVMVAALRFYLGPVDRSLPEPWSSRRARAAIDIGGLFQSELTYRGQEQRSLFKSISPTLGVSYDLTRYLSVTGGMVFYRQPSTNPLAGTSASHVRTSLFLGVGTDFDALNQLNTLLTRE
jgi:hypothetical protein